MRLSQYIALLAAFLVEHGDLPVVHHGSIIPAPAVHTASRAISNLGLGDKYIDIEF